MNKSFLGIPWIGIILIWSWTLLYDLLKLNKLFFEYSFNKLFINQQKIYVTASQQTKT